MLTLIHDFINLDIADHFSYFDHVFQSFAIADLVIIELVNFFSSHSYPLDDFLTLLSNSNALCFDVYTFVCSFLDSISKPSTDQRVLDALNFLLTFHERLIPANIIQLYNNNTSLRKF